MIAHLGFPLSFNPCYNGSGVRRGAASNITAPITVSFNPCYNGSGVRSRSRATSNPGDEKFQSLL